MDYIGTWTLWLKDPHRVAVIAAALLARGDTVPTLTTCRYLDV